MKSDRMEQTETRIQLLQNNNWKFMHGDYPEAKERDYEDSAWYDVGIPHSFAIPYFMEDYFYVGYGCYRKNLTIKKEWINKKLFLEFQGVFQETEVYVNGLPAGSHLGGYTAFVIDISSFVKEGENLIFIRVNNKWNPRVAPRAGEHVFNGGIYRDVSLIVTDPVHVSWYGTFVKTPEVSKSKAKIDISTEVENNSDVSVDCELISTVTFDGSDIFQVSSGRRLKAQETATFSQDNLIQNPRLWHPDNPQLYTLRSEVYVDGKLCDEYETVFGIRWFEFTSDKGFFLNGVHYDITGANVHQDHAGWSDAVTHAGIYRDVKMIKDCGMNFIRGSHYPHHTVFASECDKQGLLFWSELCYWGVGGFKSDGYWNCSAYPIHEQDREEFEESCVNTLREMIRTNRNHPSIIVWSLCNEVFFSRDDVIQNAKNLISRLVETAHQADPTRPAGVGGAQRGGFDVLGDIAGYNGDGARLYINPGFPSMVTEYGSYISDRPGEYTPCYTESDNITPKYDWRSGICIWCGFHHGSYLNMGHMGMIDYYRLPLKTWYWYRNELLGIAPPEPEAEGVPALLRLTSDRNVIKTDGTEDAQIMVEILDNEGKKIRNSMPVTLEIVRGGAIFPTGRTIELSPEKGNLLEGLGAIELRSYFAGEIVVAAKAEGMISTELIIKAVGDEVWNGQSCNLQITPPPVTLPPQKDEPIDIAKNRPVFCSSYQKQFPSKYVSDGNNDSWWSAAGNKAGEWIMVDLEGKKKVSAIEIGFINTKRNDFTIETSEDGKHFELLVDDTLKDSQQVVSINMKKAVFRYLKISFSDIPCDIQTVKIFE